MNETTHRFARLVDLSAVQATSTEADVRACAELAARYNIISVHVLPCWTRFLSTLLPQQGTGEVMIGGPVGFPGGGHTTDTKVQEVRQLIADGAREVDMVVNIGKVLSGDYDYVREDLRRVVEAAAPVPAKVILETHYLASGVRQTVQFDKLISPDPRLRDYYHACCELFDTLYRQSAALYDRLDALSVGPD